MEPKLCGKYLQRTFGGSEAPKDGTSQCLAAAADSTPIRVRIARWHGGGGGMHAPRAGHARQAAKQPTTTRQGPYRTCHPCHRHLEGLDPLWWGFVVLVVSWSGAREAPNRAPANLELPRLPTETFH